MPSAQTQGFLSPHRCSHSNGQHMEKKIREKLALQRPTLHRFTAYVNYGCSVCWPFLTAGPLLRSQFTLKMYESDKRRLFGSALEVTSVTLQITTQIHVFIQIRRIISNPV